MKIIKLCIFLLAIPALSYAFGFGGGGGGGRGIQIGTAGNYGLSMADNGASSFTCGDSVGHLFWESGVLKFCNPNSTTKITIGESGSSSDTVPDAFSFTDETNVAADGGQSCGAAITVGGTNCPTTISATGDTGFGYKINGGAFTSASGTYAPNDTVAPCVNRSSSNSTATTATITIGGVSDVYSVTTVAGGETYVVNDTFTGSDGVDLASHIGESGATWTQSTQSTSPIVIIGNAVTQSYGLGAGVYFASGVPPTASYIVSADIKKYRAVASNNIVGIGGRATTAGYDTYYLVKYNESSGAFELYARYGESGHSLGSFSQTLTVGTVYHIELIMNESSIVVKVDGATIISVTDGNIANAGYGIIYMNANGDASDFTIDNFVVN